MMHGADAKKRRLPKPIRYKGVDQPRPELGVTLGVGTEQSDVAEIGDPHVAYRKESRATVIWPRQYLSLLPLGSDEAMNACVCRLSHSSRVPK
jgi:hypothetical protein